LRGDSRETGDTEVEDLARQKILEKKSAFYQLSGRVLIARNIKFDSKCVIGHE
jgi:hypothetical protein